MTTENNEVTFKESQSKTRFKSSNPHIWKKTIKTIVYIGIIFALCYKLRLSTIILTILFGILPVLVIIFMQKGKGLLTKLKNYYRNMYQKYLIETLPVDIIINEKYISITLNSAEKYLGKIINQIYKIPKNSIAGILFDNVTNDILILFQDAEVKIENIKTAKGHIYKQYDSTICFSVSESDVLVNKLYEFMYPIENIDDIENAEQETEDPELADKDLLVNKIYSRLNEAKKEIEEGKNK